MIPETPESGVWKPLIKRLTNVIALGVVIVAVLVYGLVRSNTAVDHANTATSKANKALTEVKAAVAANAANAAQAKHIAECVNAILGDRAPLTAADNLAHIAFMGGIVDFLTEPADQQAKDYPALLKSLQGAVKTLRGDQTKRDKTPLGEC